MGVEKAVERAMWKAVRPIARAAMLAMEEGERPPEMSLNIEISKEGQLLEKVTLSFQRVEEEVG
jgi:hypothetical protein